MFGFRSSRSCEHALLELTEYCRKSLDLKERPLIMALDLSRAFDTVNHSLLIAKLRAYGFDSNSTSLIQSYLTNRTQCTRVNNAISQEKNVIAGVPQGSIVGPLLFNIFVNDLSTIIKGTMIRYADDTTLIVSERQPEELKAKAEKLLRRTTAWFENNYLTINPSKTQFLLLGKKSDRWNNFAILVEDKPIAPSATLTLLGVTLDGDFSFECHITNKLTKAGYALKLARSVVNVTSKSLRQALVHAYVLPHLLYCCSLFVSLPKSQLKRVNRFIKIISRSLLLQVSSTQYEDLCMTRCLVLLHQAFHLQIPALFAAQIKSNNCGYQMRSATRIILPHFTTASMANSVLVKASKKWNSFPPSMDASKKKSGSHQFKNALNKQLHI
jgi:hypothetical protein